MGFSEGYDEKLHAFAWLYTLSKYSNDLGEVK